MSRKNHEWILKSRPQGLVKNTDFEYRESDVPPLQDGETLVKVRYLAMDPATRGWMGDGGYVDPLPLDKPVMGVTVGEVLETKNPDVEVGTIVAGVGNWARYMVVPAEQMSVTRAGELGVLAPMDISSGHPIPMYLHALGTSGGTAWYGLMEIARMKAGDAVLVSGAHGSCGSLVCQYAKLKGASKVVGIAGGQEKCAELVELFGCDEAIDYKDCSDLSAAIGKAFPEGLDVFFDNVGGETLQAAMDHLAKGARIAVCGMISQYNATGASPGPENMWNLVANTASITGFLVSDYFGSPECEQAYAQIAQWLDEGKLNARVDVRDDFERIPEVFNELFTGGNRGRLMIQVASAD